MSKTTFTCLNEETIGTVVGRYHTIIVTDNASSDAMAYIPGPYLKPITIIKEWAWHAPARGEKNVSVYSTAIEWAEKVADMREIPKE